MRKKRDWAFFLGIVSVVLAVLATPVTSFAREPLRVKLPDVEVRVEGEVLQQEDYQIVLEADQDGYPMPEGSVDGKYSISVQKDAGGSFPGFSCSRPAIYTYKIYQVRGACEQCRYDDTVYEMKVVIANRPDGSGFEQEIVLGISGEEGKPERIVFVNQYPPKRPEDPGTSQDPSGDSKDPTVPQNPSGGVKDPASPKGSGGTTTATKQTEKSDGIRTGDTADIGCCIGVCGVSLAVMLLSAYKRKRRTDT